MSSRVIFFSPRDLSSHSNLQKATRVIESFSEEKAFTDINDVIELFHIRRFIENGLILPEWSEEYVRKTDGFKIIVARFFRSINPDNLAETYNSVDFEYKETFWRIIDIFDLREILNEDSLTKVCLADKYTLRYILKCGKIVRHYNSTLTSLLKQHEKAAEWLLDHFVTKHENTVSEPIVIPGTLTANDKNEIIDKYLNGGKNVNLNYVQLIIDAKDDKRNLTINPKIRLKAHRLKEEMIRPFIEQGRGVYMGISVRTSRENNIAPYSCILNDERDLVCTYDANIIDSLTFTGVIFYFQSIFEFLSEKGFLNLISMSSQEGVFERTLGLNARDTYRENLDFRLKDSLSLSQMMAMVETLSEKGRRVEEAIKFFYEDYLKSEYGYPSQKINIPSADVSYVEKFRTFVPEMDAIVKQYNLYTMEHEIDPELLALESSIKITDSASCVAQKYYIVNDNNEELNTIFYLLFGDQSLLAFVDPYKDENISSLFSLLLTRKPIDCSKYEQWQMEELMYLIKKKLFEIGEDSMLRVINWPKIKVLYHLYRYRACSFWHYSSELQSSIKEMADDGWIVCCDKLFTPEEENYFSFILNNERFTNAYAIRNHYAHGSNALIEDEKKHKIAYTRLLIMFVILLLKINDDLSIYQYLAKAGAL